MIENSITLLLTLLSAGNPPVATFPREGIEGADAMELRDQFLPAEFRADIAEGTIRREFVPGYWYRATYLTAPRPATGEFCTRTQYSIDMKATADGSGLPMSGPDLVIGPVETTVLWATAFPAANASDGACKSATGFVPIGTPEDGERRAAAYRFLVGSMRDARGQKALPFRLDCQPAFDASCGDPREALANLPLDALFRIDVTNPQKDILSDSGGVRVIKARPIEANGSYDVEFAFGRSGKDGHSWRIGWRETGQPIPEIKMRRSYVFYH